MVSGVNFRSSKFKAVEEKVVGKMADAVEAGGQVLVAKMSQKAPRATGTLSRNIVLKVERTGWQSVAAKVGPGSDAFYGKFSEQGTATEPARPWMRPAFDENKKEISKAVRDVLKGAAK